MKRATGAEELCSALVRLGVEHVFGLPGTQTIALFEALRTSAIRTILATNELAAGFMANGYYRASGRVGVLTTAPGPGFAYTVAAIAEAAQDSAAVLYIVGKPARGAIDQRAILAPLVRRIVDVNCADEIRSAVRNAYAAATAGEPGPVLLHIADGVLADETEAEHAGRDGPPPSRPVPDPALVDEALRLLCASRRAVLFAGQGVNGAATRLQHLAELLEAPVIATRSARGVLPEDHPLAMTSDYSKPALFALNALLDRSDLILALGCKFTYNGSYGFKLRLAREKLIHIDASPEVLNGNYAAKLAGCADVPAFVDAVWESRNLLTSRHPEWRQGELAGYKESGARDAGGPEPNVHGVSPATPRGFFEALRSAMPAGSCLVTDCGLHQGLATRYFRVLTPRGLVIPSDFQSMGFGLPAAIGAKLAAPERAVVALIGDGGLLMSGMETITAVRERIPITVIVFNDGALGQIRLQQLSLYGRTHATKLSTPDLELFAHAIGADYLRLEGDAEDVLRRAISANGVTLVEVKVGDNAAMRIERAKGIARRTTRVALNRSTFRWLESKLRN